MGLIGDLRIESLLGSYKGSWLWRAFWLYVSLYFYIIDLAKLYCIVERLPRFISVNGPLILDWDQAPRGGGGKNEKKIGERNDQYCDARLASHS